MVWYDRTPPYRIWGIKRHLFFLLVHHAMQSLLLRVVWSPSSVPPLWDKMIYFISLLFVYQTRQRVASSPSSVPPLWEKTEYFFFHIRLPDTPKSSSWSGIIAPLEPGMLLTVLGRQWGKFCTPPSGSKLTTRTQGSPWREDQRGAPRDSTSRVGWRRLNYVCSRIYLYPACWCLISVLYHYL